MLYNYYINLDFVVETILDFPQMDFGQDLVSDSQAYDTFVDLHSRCPASSPLYERRRETNPASNLLIALRSILRTGNMQIILIACFSKTKYDDLVHDARFSTAKYDCSYRKPLFYFPTTHRCILMKL
jgi:hypothetical protein